jgi:hypothetical protein
VSDVSCLVLCSDVWHAMQHHRHFNYAFWMDVSAAHSLTHSLDSLTHSLCAALNITYSLTHLLTVCYTHSLAHSLCTALINTQYHSRTHSITHSITHSLTHSLCCPQILLQIAWGYVSRALGHLLVALALSLITGLGYGG